MRVWVPNGVGIAREAAWVLAHAHHRAQLRGRCGEGQPPQCCRLDERDGQQTTTVTVSPASAAVAPVATMDSPKAMMMKPWQRSAK